MAGPQQRKGNEHSLIWRYIEVFYFLIDTEEVASIYVALKPSFSQKIKIKKSIERRSRLLKQFFFWFFSP